MRSKRPYRLRDILHKWRSSDEEIDCAFSRFDLDKRLGYEEHRRITDSLRVQLLYDLLVFLSHCSGAIKVEEFHQRLTPSSFIVLSNLIGDATDMRFLNRYDDLIEITYKGLKWRDEEAHRYKNAAFRDQETEAFADTTKP